jgi:hypothetical protein
LFQSWKRSYQQLEETGSGVIDRRKAQEGDATKLRLRLKNDGCHRLASAVISPPAILMNLGLKAGSHKK